MLGKLKGAYWVSAVKLSKARDVEIDFCFEPKIEFYNPQDEHDLKKTFVDLENLYREKLEKKKNCCQKQWKWKRRIREK